MTHPTLSYSVSDWLTLASLPNPCKYHPSCLNLTNPTKKRQQVLASKMESRAGHAFTILGKENVPSIHHVCVHACKIKTTGMKIKWTHYHEHWLKGSPDLTNPGLWYNASVDHIMHQRIGQNCCVNIVNLWLHFVQYQKHSLSVNVWECFLCKQGTSLYGQSF